MNTVLEYVIGCDLLNCHAKFRGDTISRFLKTKMTFEVTIFVVFRKIVTSAVTYGRPDVTLSGGTACRVTVLVLFVSVKSEARRSFG